MTTADIISRAKACCYPPNKPVKYGLGKGGFDPRAAFPQQMGQLDCSGFAAFCLGVPREYAGIPGGWIETTDVCNDATKTHKAFRRVEAARPGDVIVYGDSGGHQGHIGVITAASNGVPVRVAHCCARARVPSAIIEEPFSVFWAGAVRTRGAIYARPLFIESEEEDLKPIKVVIDGKQVDGLLDADKGVSYVAVKGAFPKATFSWSPDRSKLEVSPPAK